MSQLQFTAPSVDRLNFLSSLTGGRITINGQNGNKHELDIHAIQREDGSGNRFLFEATMVRSIAASGLSQRMDVPYKGYFDTKTQTGWLQANKIAAVVAKM